MTRRRRSNMPEFAADLIGKKIRIPHYDVPTVAGRPVELIASKPDVWQNVPPRRGKGKAGKFT